MLESFYFSFFWESWNTEKIDNHLGNKCTEFYSTVRHNKIKLRGGIADDLAWLVKK